MMRTGSLIVLYVVLLNGCAEQQEEGAASSDRTPVVSVSNYPLQYFVERLAPWIDVQFPADASGDPAYWRPTAEEISRMQEADLIILNGASYESWLANVSLSPAKLVDTSADLTGRFIPLEGHTTHSHGLEGDHEHSGTAFTLWLDLTLAQAQVQALSNAMAKKWPLRRAEIEQAATALIGELESLDSQLAAVVSEAADRLVLFSHPVYQYLQKRYGMNGRSVHWEPDAMPDEAMWKELTELVATHPAQWMIWEGQPLPEIVTKLAEMGIESVVFDPCAGKPEEGDFMTAMKQNVAELQKVYSPQP
ncbi:MAG: zinc ABC transporter substrate-binding protein [Phycisphaerales bacterium]|nr:MAG: zinc ABC transporter substrate-binding protein [Phycisphaerales bacterium]